ncbi:MAG TPA: hypothetical protein VFD47_01055, partial [Actinomycetota bacterium]|nr:hypothetical protein [Actinomycetota bacterium]
RGLESIEQPGPEVMFDHVYASDNPWTFTEGLEEVNSVARKPEVAPPQPPSPPSAGDVEIQPESSPPGAPNAEEA